MRAIWNPGNGGRARVKASIRYVTLVDNIFQDIFTKTVFERGVNPGLCRTYGAQTALANRCPSPYGLGYVSAGPPGLTLLRGLQGELADLQMRHRDHRPLRGSSLCSE
jgi:hypothetical protein